MLSASAKLVANSLKDILPVIIAAIECPTHSIVDAALRTLPSVLPALDFSTIKNELFPVVATVFSKTNSLAIKVRGLQSFVVLCGGSSEAANDDGLSGLLQENKKTSSSTALDKYTMQEKIVPLIKAIKTKEPAVMIAALNVLRIVGQVADADFVAMDILPVLWSMSLGPLLDLKQFQTFMALIKELSRRVEDEQTRKLQELSGTSNGAKAAPNEDFLAFGGVTGTTFDLNTSGDTPDDFEALVKGKGGITASGSGSGNGFGSWDDPAPAKAPSAGMASVPSTPQTPAFSWSSQPAASPTTSHMSQQSSFRTVTPDLGRFEAMAPSSTQFSKPLQPTQSIASQATTQQSTSSMNSANWATASAATQNPWASTSPSSSTPNYSSNSMGNSMNNSMANMSMGGRPSLGGQSSSRGSSFSLPPPPGAQTPSYNSSSSFGIAPPPAQSSWNSNTSNMNKPMGNQSMGSMMGSRNTSAAAPATNSSANTPQKTGLDKYQSLI